VRCWSFHLTWLHLYRVPSAGQRARASRSCAVSLFLVASVEKPSLNHSRELRQKDEVSQLGMDAARSGTAAFSTAIARFSSTVISCKNIEAKQWTKNRLDTSPGAVVVQKWAAGAAPSAPSMISLISVIGSGRLQCLAGSLRHLTLPDFESPCRAATSTRILSP